MNAADDKLPALEGLSALADGEADARVAAAVSAAWRDDGTVRARWHSYQLIGDVMRSDELAGRGRDAAFLAAVRARLAAEPVVLAPALPAVAVDAEVDRLVSSSAGAGRVSRSRVRRWAPPVALAAGFMVVAVGAMTILRPAAPDVAVPALAQGSAVGTGTGLRPVADAPPSFAAQSAPLTLAAENEPVPERAAAVLIRDPRLDAYLAAHKQFGGSSALGVPSGFLRSATHEGSAPGPR